MAEGTSNIYSQLFETVAKVKQQQDQHQKAIETITQQLTQFYEAAKEIRAVLSTRCFDSNNREESMMANEEGQEWEVSSQKNKNGKHSESSEKGKTSSNKKMKKWQYDTPTTNVQTKAHPTNSGQTNIRPKLENRNEIEKEVEEGTPKKKRNIDDKQTKALTKYHNVNSPTSSTPKIGEMPKVGGKRKRSGDDKEETKVNKRPNIDDLSDD